MLWREKKTTSPISLSGLLLPSQALTLADAVAVLSVHSCTSPLPCLVFLPCWESLFIPLPVAVARHSTRDVPHWNGDTGEQQRKFTATNY